MSILPALIGISIHEKKCYYLIWVPSESGPLIINYGITKVKNEKIPIDYFYDKIKKHNLNPQFTISLDSNDVKYNFLQSYNNPLINSWNNSHYYDEVFNELYDPYVYQNQEGEFNIYILKVRKNNIISQLSEEQYTLVNLNVGIFSALEGVRSWYDITHLNEYIILKFSKKGIIELLSIKEDNFSSHMYLKKQENDFSIISFFGIFVYYGYCLTPKIV